MEYIRFALSEECQPLLVSDSTLSATLLDRSVLDHRCEDWPEFFDDSANSVCLSESVLKEGLRDFFSTNFPISSNNPFVLSLSGGVDSMSLAVLLKELGVPFIAVHIRHSSRLEDTAKELEWAKFVCTKFDIPLYYHHVQVARPHGGDSMLDNNPELSRDQFEEYTREIRFNMYAKAFKLHQRKIVAAACLVDSASPIYVLIGHHIDDIDENRVAELGKGNLMNIDGMADAASDTCYSNIVQLRPFCKFVRKAAIREFALARRIPHMKNSTPVWSRRGWIRAVLDDMSEDMQQFVLTSLTDLGKRSGEVDEALHAVAREWTKGSLKVGKKIGFFSKTRSAELPVVSIDMDVLVRLLEEKELMVRLDKLREKAVAFGNIWNKLVKEYCLSKRPGDSCPIQPISHFFGSVVEELVNRVFQLSFDSWKECSLGLGKFIGRKCVNQLIEANNGGKRIFSWKINGNDYLVVKIEDTLWLITEKVNVDLKKALTSSVDRLQLIN